MGIHSAAAIGPKSCEAYMVGCVHDLLYVQCISGCACTHTNSGFPVIHVMKLMVAESRQNNSEGFYIICNILCNTPNKDEDLHGHRVTV